MNELYMRNLDFIEDEKNWAPEIAIIDITGVPTVDTLVAQHLLKTVTAIRLMGADCIISGVRPQIAQTIVHLGLDLQGVVTKANLADALALALEALAGVKPEDEAGRAARNGFKIHALRTIVVTREVAVSEGDTKLVEACDRAQEEVAGHETSGS